MRNAILAVTAVSILTACVRPSSGEPVRWKNGDGGNNHYYEVISPGSLNWLAALADAKTQSQPAAGYGTGYLASIQSAEEQAFIMGETATAFYNLQ